MSRKQRTIELVVLVLVGIMAVHYFVSLLIDHPIDYNCSNFKNYQEAIQVYQQYETDIYNLDSNHDGVPCQMLINK